MEERSSAAEVYIGRHPEKPFIFLMEKSMRISTKSQKKDKLSVVTL